MPDSSLNPEPAPTRDDLVARLDLIESMIAEGRRATGRFGWTFVLWGLVILAALALEWTHPGRAWNWPVAISCGWVLQFAGFFWLRSRGEYRCRPNAKGRAMMAIWSMMGVTLALYCFTGAFTHHFGVAYLAAIFMIIGFAHAASAIILRWRPQGAVAAMWWAGGLACFFITGYWLLAIFAAEMLFGMVFFGLYIMFLDRVDRRMPPSTVANHA